MYNGVKEEINRKMNIITRTELNDKNLVKAINMRVAVYQMNLNSLNLNLRN